ncbi:hypothetical protein KP803_07850 [Vibrio sp. ZSDE26]|uniref:DUF3108 domain-containing protein n=1 Tax=Vibrio amylolyticus TaxID=2847292 RepID=A0A9X1XHD6_9VIBR|nr:hypothetical protein [Vibrio amylolyticus]MCK6263187.1 hypothetical protein [Vibrio amylolyticus]
MNDSQYLKAIPDVFMSLRLLLMQFVFFVLFFGTSFSANATAVSLCIKVLEYNLYLSGISTGYMRKNEQWLAEVVTAKSRSRASILGIGSSYTQSSEMVLEEGVWLTQSFHQKVTGFRKRDMLVSFPNSVNHSLVMLNGEEHRYESDDEPLRDIDTITMQIRQNLIDQKKSFSLVRQASDGIEAYQYEVLASQVREYERWGDMDVIPVKQSGADKITYYYSPRLDYQIVEARYHGFLLNGRAELVDFTSSCN